MFFFYNAKVGKIFQISKSFFSVCFFPPTGDRVYCLGCFNVGKIAVYNILDTASDCLESVTVGHVLRNHKGVGSVAGYPIKFGSGYMAVYLLDIKVQLSPLDLIIPFAPKRHGRMFPNRPVLMLLGVNILNLNGLDNDKVILELRLEHKVDTGDFIDLFHNVMFLFV